MYVCVCVSDACVCVCLCVCGSTFVQAKTSPTILPASQALAARHLEHVPGDNYGSKLYSLAMYAVSAVLFLVRAGPVHWDAGGESLTERDGDGV